MGETRRALYAACISGVLMLAVVSAAAQRDPAGHYAAPADGQPLCALKIHVTGFRNAKGHAGGTVFASPQGWPEDTSKAVVHGGFPIEDGQATEVFQLPAGKYAIAVIHDENGNHKLDRNFLGIPKEGFGFANNPRVMLSAPPFQAASTQVSCPETQLEIRLIYK
jgi:uncharacterized protein (DUF2141 family)